MKTALIPVVLAALAANVVPSPPADANAPEAKIAAEDAAPIDAAPAAIEAAPIDAPVDALRLVDARVPADMKVIVRPDGADWSVAVKRTGQVIALRRGTDRAVASGVASLWIRRGHEASVPIVWEATDPEKLTTTRGLLRLAPAAAAKGSLPAAELRLAESPATIDAGEQKNLHRCVTEDDGFGGFTVLCRVGGFASVANASAADPRQDVWAIAVGEDHSLVRLSIPAGFQGTASRLAGYVEGARGVLIRAEASRLPGEDKPTITVLSADRPQPILPRRMWRERIWDDML